MGGTGGRPSREKKTPFWMQQDLKLDAEPEESRPPVMAAGEGGGAKRGGEKGQKRGGGAFVALERAEKTPGGASSAFGGTGGAAKKSRKQPEEEEGEDGRGGGPVQDATDAVRRAATAKKAKAKLDTWVKSLDKVATLAYEEWWFDRWTTKTTGPDGRPGTVNNKTPEQRQRLQDSLVKEIVELFIRPSLDKLKESAEEVLKCEADVEDADAAASDGE